MIYIFVVFFFLLKISKGDAGENSWAGLQQESAEGTEWRDETMAGACRWWDGCASLWKCLAQKTSESVSVLLYNDHILVRSVFFCVADGFKSVWESHLLLMSFVEGGVFVCVFAGWRRSSVRPNRSKQSLTWWPVTSVKTEAVKKSFRIGYFNRKIRFVTFRVSGGKMHVYDFMWCSGDGIHCVERRKQEINCKGRFVFTCLLE